MLFNLRVKYLEGPGAPELEVIAPASADIESLFLGWLVAQNVRPSVVQVDRTTRRVIASARLFEHDGRAAIPRRAADVMVYVRRCLASLDSGASSETEETLARTS